MLISVLENIICTTFEKEIGRGQRDKEKQYAMDISFMLSVDVNVEEGYRTLFVRIYAPSNYVGILTKESWNCYNLKDVADYDEDGIVFKEGKDYINGNSGWERQSYHDSCWRSDGIHSILYQYRDKIVTIESMQHWFQRYEMNEKDLEEFNDAILKKG